MNFKHQYALYKGDEFLCVGSINELAKYQGCSEKAIKHMSYPCYHKKVKKYNERLIVIKLEEK